MKRTKLVYGVGVNDADYIVRPANNNSKDDCHLYRTWKSMLMRCYNVKFQQKHKSYIDCTVAPEWHSFMNFRDWMIKQDWQGKHLDKDILVVGNKVYRPDLCIFISQQLNNFTVDHSSAIREWPTGVYFDKRVQKFIARCRNPFSGKHEILGHFNDPDLGHLAWKARKHELACLIADQQSDHRIANALRERYIAGDKS